MRTARGLFWIAAVVLIFVSLLSGFSIGMFIAPFAASALVAAALIDARIGETTAGSRIIGITFSLLLMALFSAYTISLLDGDAPNWMLLWSSLALGATIATVVQICSWIHANRRHAAV
ncbi:MAG: hypothetical protein ACRDKI_12465 [Solirubrobacterales bacterium]